MSASVAPGAMSAALTDAERDRVLAKSALFDPPPVVTADGRRDRVGLSREELGAEVGELTPIATFYTTPGFCTEQIHLFYTEVTARPEAGGGLAAEGESLAICILTPEAFYARPLHDAKTLVAREWARSRQLAQSHR